MDPRHGVPFEEASSRKGGANEGFNVGAHFKCRHGRHHALGNMTLSSFFWP